MLFSLALLLLAGMLGGELFSRLKLPPLLGMMAAGILIGPYCFNGLDSQLLELSGVLRKIALLIILIRAGLNLKIEDLKKAGRPAILLCFLPATFEIIAFLIFAPLLLGFDLLEAAILGCVMAAVSPAVVVPGMLKVIDDGYGQDKAIPQMILAGASADDVYVLVLFSVFTTLASQGSFHAETLLRIPTAILFGAGVGFITGLLLCRLFSWKKSGLQTAAQVLVLLAMGMLFYALEDFMTGPVAFSGLIAIIVTAMVIGARLPKTGKTLANGFNQLWKGGEIFLFVLIGAAVNLPYAFRALPVNLLLIILCLLVRSVGVMLCVSHTRLTFKEKLFCIAAYLPKATVQAAIGATPLAMGLAGGESILSCAVTAILFTAPLGAILIHRLYPIWLTPPKKGKPGREATLQNS